MSDQYNTNGMDLCRWKEVMNDESKRLTNEEISKGWHFCYEFDGLLVGPAEGDGGEWACCSCFTQEEKDAFLAKAKSNES
jgi:hypothetical protein